MAAHPVGHQRQAVIGIRNVAVLVVVAPALMGGAGYVVTKCNHGFLFNGPRALLLSELAGLRVPAVANRTPDSARCVQARYAAVRLRPLFLA